VKPSKRRKSYRRKSNPWDNPLTPEHKAIRLAARVLSEDSPHKFPPGMGGPEPDLSGVTLADSIAVIEGMLTRTKDRITRNGLVCSLATLDQKWAALRL
jgi:hypothetical protein